MQLLLHVGCGPTTIEHLPSYFHDNWLEVRLDVDPSVQPDILASITDLSVIEDESFDAVYSSHNIEHLESHQVAVALGEIFRVLKVGGEFWVHTPDLTGIARAILAGTLEEPLYQSAVGPIRPLDMLFGWEVALRRGETYMAHRTGFTQQTLHNHLQQAGFNSIHPIPQALANYELFFIAHKTP